MNLFSKPYILSVLLLFVFTSCNFKNQEKEIVFNKDLANQLSKMNEIDQYYAGIPQGKYEGNWDAWYSARDSVNRIHKNVLDSIIKIYGYPGFDLVGESGESDFWVMVQHADFDVDFQESVLPMLKEEIDKNNANGSHYGLLTDRVLKNNNKPQLYGTQVDYNEFGQAYIKSLQDSLNANKRRKALGMESLQSYLNGMTEAHFVMNKEYLLKKGITAPKLYKIPEKY